jgi:hypothetical protein
MAEKNKSGYSLNGHPCAQEEIDKKEGMPISPFKYAGCTYKKNSGQSTDWQNTAHERVSRILCKRRLITAEASSPQIE